MPEVYHDSAPPVQIGLEKIADDRWQVYYDGKRVGFVEKLPTGAYRASDIRDATWGDAGDKGTAARKLISAPSPDLPGTYKRHGRNDWRKVLMPPYRADLIQSDQAVHDLALRAEHATNGAVRFQYATAPSATTYWVFDHGYDTPTFEDAPYHERMNEKELTRWLNRVIAWAESEVS